MTDAAPTIWKWVLAAAGIVVVMTVAAIVTVVAGVISFGAPTRPAWATIILLLIMVAAPLGIALTLVIRAGGGASSGRNWLALAMMSAALVTPFFAYAAGISLIAVGILP